MRNLLAFFGALQRRRKRQESAPPDTEYATTVLWSVLNPSAGSNVTINSDTHVILDTVTPSMGEVSVMGKLSVKTDVPTVGLTCTQMHAHGKVHIGTEASPYLGNATITLTGVNPGPVGAHTAPRSMMFMDGGEFLAFGDTSRVHRTRLAADAAAGATTLVVEDATGWQIGDDIAIGPTDYFNQSGRTQRVSITNIVGNTITISAPLAFAKFGRLQYVNDSGLSFTNGTFTPDASSPVGANYPRILDERAMIVNLTRKIVITCPSDTEWTTNGNGAHVMIMPGASAKVSGVRFKNGGQRGILGRYPFHWHMLSYEQYNAADPVNSGKGYLGPATGQYVRNCVVEDSANRGIVVHGTNGVEVSDSVCVAIRGHAFFLENGVERRNQIHNNVALLMNDPHPGVSATSMQFTPTGGAAGGVRLAAHEAGQQVAGYWITNPDNDFTGNWCADSVGNGIWFSFAEKPFGPSRNVVLPNTSTKMGPRYMTHGEISDNYSQACYRFGALTEFFMIDEAGNLGSGGYQPMSGNAQGSGSIQSYIVTRLNVFKCGDRNATATGAYLNRSFPVWYREMLVADCMPNGIHGSAEGRLDRCVMVGRTLNTPTTQTADRVGVQTYHFSVAQVNCVFVNLPYAVGKNNTDRDVGAGAQSFIDLYLSAVEPGTMMTVGSKFINSHPGYRCKPPWMKGRGENFTFAGAVLDPWGYWGEAGTYMVYGNYAPQNAYFTHGLSDAVAHEPSTMGTVATHTRYFGVGSFRTEQNPTEYQPRMPVRVLRQDNTTGATVGEWFVADGAGGGSLPYMHHFAVANGGRYQCSFPYANGTPHPSQFHQFVIQNGWRSDDRVLIGMPWAGATAKVYARAKMELQKSGGIPLVDNSAISRGEARLAQTVASSIAEVADPVGNADASKVYVDTATDTCWFIHKGGLVYPNEAEMLQVPFPTQYTSSYMEQFKRPYYYAILP